MITRFFLTICAAACIAAGSLPSSNAASFRDQVREPNTDRPGGDFTNFDVDPAPPFLTAEANCVEQCRHNPRCLAWTFVQPGVQGPKARCWLKAVIPAPRPSNCCVSGVDPKPFEPNTDRPGSDFTNFDLAAANPDLCRTACRNNSVCIGWTYVRPGIQGPNARCWLKNDLPAAHASDCCTSGVSDRPPPIH